jgi:hypothetical protein
VSIDFSSSISRRSSSQKLVKNALLDPVSVVASSIDAADVDDDEIVCRPVSSSSIPPPPRLGLRRRSEQP